MRETQHINVQGDHYKVREDPELDPTGPDPGCGSTQLIRQIGAASTVLLKNNNSLPLPLPQDLRSIVVIGSDAQNSTGGPNECPDRGCDSGTLAMASCSFLTECVLMSDSRLAGVG